MRKQLAAALALAGLLACGNPDSEAVRHLVIAELIQSERVPESQISILSVQFPDFQTAVAEVYILQSATKSPYPARKVICRLERKADRWNLVSVQSVF